MHDSAPDIASLAPAASLAATREQLLAPAGRDLPVLERVGLDLTGP
ncbi:MAG: hypothetical protein AB7I32_12835 [Gammaproteobacteria bacterium]